MNREDEFHELQQAAEKLAILAKKLSSDQKYTGFIEEDVSIINQLVCAEEMYRQRRKREKFFDNGLFGEPAWDILLDLFISWGRGKSVSISSACLAANVPTTTALRWIQALLGQDLVRRSADQSDARRVNVALSENGYILMSEFLKNCILSSRR